MADTTRTDDSRAASCTICSTIPNSLVVNTGRDERFPVEVHRLSSLELAESHDLRQCPECGALFEWEDMPQFYGSGNNAEEALTRLDPARASLVEELLDTEPGERDSELLCTQAFKTLSFALVCRLLSRLAYSHRQVFAGFLAPIVAELAARSDFELANIVVGYCGEDGGRLEELRRLLDDVASENNPCIEYLRKKCGARVVKPRRTSKEVAAELYTLLTTVCRSYAARRANPPAEPAYDMTDFMHVCWDFAAHAVDMLQAGRHEELAPVFLAMAEFCDQSNEYWMRDGLAPVFERIWDEGKWRDVDVSPLEPVIGPAFQHLWRHIEDPYDGDPYPIDGFY